MCGSLNNKLAAKVQAFLDSVVKMDISQTNEHVARKYNDGSELTRIPAHEKPRKKMKIGPPSLHGGNQSVGECP